MLEAEEIIQRVRAYQPQADGDLIKRAYDYSLKAHNGQMR
jgi:GTP pyrophosphokinase